MQPTGSTIFNLSNMTTRTYYFNLEIHLFTSDINPVFNPIPFTFTKGGGMILMF